MNTEIPILDNTQEALPPQQDAFTSFFDEQKEDTFDFSKSRIKLKRVVDDWSPEEKLTEQRRKTRDIDVDVRALRASGKLDEDETLIPDRVIDTNIQREQPPYINYLKNSRRLAIFTCTSNPDITDSQKLELEYTRGMTYNSWETPFYKCLDGAQTHGWDAIEVVYDESKPLHVGFEHIGHEKLLFPMTCLDIQDSALVIRAYDVTISQLKKFVDSFGFSREQVGNIISTRKNNQKENETVRIYKKYCKYDTVVYVAWFSTEHGCSDWLKSPIPLYLGIKNQTQDGQWVDAQIKQYPIFVLPYRETEKPKVTDHKGRVFLDENKQEAQTAILSSFVNGLYRATQVYASRGQDDGTGSSLQEEENIQLSGNRILNKPISFFHTDYPDPMVLKALQYFDSSNAEETNQVTYAVNNRQDSRKTAREVQSAETKESLLNSVQLTLFSTHIRSIHSLAWLIVQSQALQNAIVFLQIKKQRPVINPIVGSPVIDPQTGQPQIEDYFENDYQTISQTYDIRAAGDVDVILKAEKINQMKQDWPVIANTVLKDVFLAELIRLQYPDTGEKWAQVLMTQGSQFEMMKGLMSGMGQILASVFQDHPEILQTLQPQEQNAVQQMIAQSQQLATQTKPV